MKCCHGPCPTDLQEKNIEICKREIERDKWRQECTLKSSRFNDNSPLSLRKRKKEKDSGFPDGLGSSSSSEKIVCTKAQYFCIYISKNLKV